MNLWPISTVASDRDGAARSIAELIRRGLEDERRWDDIESALSGIPDTGHEWDEDPSSWVRAQRRGDVRRAG